MLFNSIHFLFFFPVVTLLYFLFPHKLRWALLLASSCYFYMVFIPSYILVLALIILIDYCSALLIEKSQLQSRRKIFLLLSLSANLGVLFIFKYYNFISINISELAGNFNADHSLPLLQLVLPIGLSFHTFQAMSYTIEVYRKRQKAERHFGIYALYVMYYPQLVAGPIERPQNLLHQFKEEKKFDYARVVSGLRFMLWGFFIKIVVAENLSPLVDAVYSDPYHYKGLPLLMSSLFFSFQIYCDFAGYSLIAIGASRVMGIELMKNFNTPYFSKSIAEFWRRWHISLSTWFKDYVYIPLGGNKVAVSRMYLNLMIVFLLSGIWHGANWTFLVWGILHGVYLVISLVAGKQGAHIKASTYPYTNKLIRVFFTFSLVTVAWVFFRASSIKDAWYLITSALSISGTFRSLPISKYYCLYVLALILVLIISEFLQKNPFSVRTFRKYSTLRYLIYFILAYSTVLTYLFSGSADRTFIYFQF